MQEIVVRSKLAVGSTSMDDEGSREQAIEWVGLMTAPEDRWAEVYVYCMRRRKKHDNLSVTELNEAWAEIQLNEMPPPQTAACIFCEFAERNGGDCRFHGPAGVYSKNKLV